ncbi:40S ribosomal protein S10 isoform X3 [Formica exsecta]|uniref:40S ribosomal protein S10 isoform X3 n=1 Tax=Formica exsecta TaxID=72781 RepID=UPI0011440DB7|nr:40S ribosomal protein S10 isoform X3 [Formica exsecta]
MQLSKLKKRRERTLSVHFPHVLKDKKDVENLFTGNFYIKLPRQSSRSCHVVFSNVEEKITNYKSAKEKTINGKRIVIKPLCALVKKNAKKIKRKKVCIPEIKPDIKVTQALFVSNIATGIKSHELKGALPGCVHVTLLKSYNKDFKMLMPKKNRVAIYEYLFKEGVMVAKKDYHASKHPELENIPNLQVIKAMQSLKSRGYVKEQFAWRHFYWYLTNDGIEYLRGYLHLPPEIVPSTLKKQPRSETTRPRPAATRSEGSRPTEDRAGYRRGPGGPPGAGDKKADVGAGTGDLEFRGGFGRGKALQ